jgi:photosystem II stability/assembly factor-like uncharacterized protein
MLMRRLAALAAFAACAAVVSADAAVVPYQTPSAKLPAGSQVPIMAITGAGKRLVAVGMRGYIATSDDDGKTWHQANVPVSSDLVAVDFPTAMQGWAVGHGGVVLHSANGGADWQVQLSGNQATQLSLAHYAQLPVPDGDKELANVVTQEKSIAAGDGTPSFLSVHFKSEREGFVVGTFNRIFHTDDAGKTWQPWMDRTSNPQYLNFNVVTERDGVWYLAGEHGMVWKSDADGQHFTPAPTEYKGTFFGLLVTRTGTILTYGMRGNLFRSADVGKTWTKIATGTNYGIVDGVNLPDGRIALAYQAGGFGLSSDDGASFVGVPGAMAMSNFAVGLAGANRLIFSGDKGFEFDSLRVNGSAAQAPQSNR